MKRSAFGLVSVVGAIGIVGLILLISGPLVRTILQGCRMADRAAADLAGVDDFTGELRRDVWTGRQLTAGTRRLLVIQQADDRTIAWRIAEDGLGIERLSWKGQTLLSQKSWRCAQELSVSVEGFSSVVLEAAGNDKARGGRRVLVSELILAGALEP